MKITQREARRLKKRVAELEQIQAGQRSSWTRQYPGGVHLVNINVEGDSKGRLEGAQMLSHPLVAKLEGYVVRIYAIP